MALQCPSCKTDNPDDSKFCRECAAPLKSSKKGDVSRTRSIRAQHGPEGRVVAGKYRILRELGRGGMGVVYEARDLRLERPVALKFLAPELTQDKEAKERFVQEAQTASALDHQNICTVYDIDEDRDRRMFIAMGFIEGGSLRERLERGPLELDEAIGIARQAAEGLARAHAKGIVHRDIKPANIMLGPEGVVKVVDFGLAKLAGQVKLTQAGATVGTVAYMSPEQARGEDLDQRSDIWSLGVVLYEMLAGRPPFRGEGIQGVIYSILNREPEPPGRARPDLPVPVERIVLKALEKDKFRRCSSMDELLKDLKAAQSPEAALPKAEKSIIILPFENISPDPEQEYFCDGMTEEIIADLSAVRSLRVISRSSAITFKGTKKKVDEIAREVNVRYVLEGSVRKSGKNLRITAQLIDAATDAHLWAEKYGGTLDDVFDIQEKVSRSIVDALKLKLTPEEAELLAERPIPNPLAYEFYLKARQEILKWTEPGLANATKYLQNGLEIAGENALLYAGMAYVHFQYYNLGLKEEACSRQQAGEYLHKAFALDPDCVTANFIQAMLIAWYEPKEGIRYFKRVLDKNPNDFDTLFYFSCLIGTLGRRNAVIPLEERTIKIDPLNPAAHFHSGFNRLWEGKYALALEVLGRLHRQFPEDVLTKWSYGLSLAYMDRREEGGLIFGEVAREQPGTVFASLGLAFRAALEGRNSEALTMLDANPCLQKPRDFQFAYWKTECYALIGENERALDMLEHDVNLGMVNYPLMSELDPFLASIRGGERFQKLMERVKKEWEEFEV